MYKELALFAEGLGSKVETDVSMSRYTSFKAGGNADILITPDSVDSLNKILNFCREKGIKTLVIGNGSNLLVTDGGFHGAVIKIGSDISEIKLIDDCTVYCGSGASMKALCMFALENSLSGLEFAYGIPGTVGGAVYMNAGAYGGEMRDVLVSCSHIDNNGEAGTLSKDELNLGYRKSAYTDNGFVITSATLRLKKGSKDDIKAEMNDKLLRRREKQPLEYPSAGSTFKRPEGYFAGALIEDCGLKGYSVGRAQVSERHAGFVINKGGASAGDILALIKYVQNTVYKKHGVMLETEVRIVGE